MTTAVEQALAYAARGWYVLPLKAGSKAPVGALATAAWKSATTDPAQIQRWWGGRPSLGVGIACVSSGLLALDIDPRHGGDDDLHDLERQLGPLPATVTNLTGGGGQHLLFQDPGVPVRGELRPGVEIKSRGYIVAPPTTHRSGRPYAWSCDGHPEDVPVAALPPTWQHAVIATDRAKLAAVPTPGTLREAQAADDYLLTLSPERYFRVLAGVTLNGAGLVRCPLPDHEDRTPSCQVFATAERGWWCYGCKRGGTIYAFAACLAGIDPKQLRGAAFLNVQDTIFRLVEADAQPRAS